MESEGTDSSSWGGQEAWAMQLRWKLHSAIKILPILWGGVLKISEFVSAALHNSYVNSANARK